MPGIEINIGDDIWMVDLDVVNFILVRADSGGAARKWAVDMYGTMHVGEVKRPTEDDVIWYRAMGGEVYDAEAERGGSSTEKPSDKGQETQNQEQGNDRGS